MVNVSEFEFFNKENISKIISANDDVAKGYVSFSMYQSDREWSGSLYITFLLKSNSGVWKKNSTLRVSDHVSSSCIHSQFIISRDKKITKRKKEQFVRFINAAIKKAKTRHLYYQFKELGKNEK